MRNISVSEIEYIFFNQRKEMFVKVAYQFLSTFIKSYPDKYFSAKKFQRLKWNTLFSIKGRKCMWKKTINSCHILKNVFRQVLPCQKVSVSENEIIFAIKGTVNIWTNTTNFSHLSKNEFRQVRPCQKTSVFEIDYTFSIKRRKCL